MAAAMEEAVAREAAAVKAAEEAAALRVEEAVAAAMEEAPHAHVHHEQTAVASTPWRLLLQKPRRRRRSD